MSALNGRITRSSLAAAAGAGFALTLALLAGCGGRDVREAVAAAPSAADSTVADWPAYGRDPGGGRYAPLAQITRANVARLAVAWTYRTGELAPEWATKNPTALETTPIVVDGTMYISTPLGRVIALDPQRGTERWRYDPRVDRNGNYGDFANRGVSTWLDSARAPGAPCRRRIFVATIDSRLVALDAAAGAPCADFGEAGIVDLKRGLLNAPAYAGEYEMTSPPAVINGLIVVGSAIADNNRADAPSGVVRATRSTRRGARGRGRRRIAPGPPTRGR
ncbi:MAG: PQQ-binding-like beta-propeller repeat protein [Gemmatimonadaceae bacterium]